MPEYSLSRDARVSALSKLKAMGEGAYFVLMSRGEKVAARFLAENAETFAECLRSKPSKPRLVADVAAFKQAVDDVLHFVKDDKLRSSLTEAMTRNVGEISQLLDDWSAMGKKKKGPLPPKKGGGDAK